MTPFAAGEIIKKSFEELYGRPPTNSETQAIYGVGMLETGCGEGWKAGEGQGSHNWGAVQCCKPGSDGECPAGSFMHTDHHRKSDGTMVAYQICFKSYPDDFEGAKDMIHLIFRQPGSETFQAASNGDTLGISWGMFKNHYFEGFGKDDNEAVLNHAKSIQKYAERYATAVGEPLALHLNTTQESGKPGNGLGPIFGITALVLSIWALSKRYAQ